MPLPKILHKFVTTDNRKIEVFASERRRYGKETITWLRAIVDGDIENNIPVCGDPFPSYTPPAASSLWSLRCAGFDITPTSQAIAWLKRMESQRRFTHVNKHDALNFA